eukprot:gene10275-13816_t
MDFDYDDIYDMKNSFQSKENKTLRTNAWVWKKSSKIRQWRKRYAYLEDYTLNFSENPFSPPHMKIDLRECSNVSTVLELSVFERKNIEVFKIELTTETNPIVMRNFTGSKFSSNIDWTLLLRRVIEKVNLGNMLINFSLQNDTENVEDLINNNKLLDVNYVSHKFKTTALIIASENNNAELVRVLIKANAQLDLTNKHGYSALAIATERNAYDTASLLMMAGAKTSNMTIRRFKAGSNTLQ